MLELDNVTVRFGGLAALSGLTLRLGGEEVLGLVGANGAGKTTLLNAISGLVRPQSGAIRLNGRDVTRAPLFRRARLGIGRTFQIPQPMQQLTVRENLMVAQRFGAGAIDQRRLDAILDFTGLTAKAGADAASALALTELKALELAKALATAPTLLLLDEVLAGLETSGKRHMMGLLKEVQLRFSLALIIIEHDIEVIAALCPRVAVLDFGRLIADGTPAAVFRDPAVIASYVGNTGGAQHA